jgi:hypothetical protein
VLASALFALGLQAPDSGRLHVGLEYVLIDNPGRVARTARMLAPIGLTAAKHYAEHVDWGAMQKAANAPIDFTRLDAFVREFQAIGVEEPVICLRSASPWASKGYARLRSTNLTPKLQHLAAYERWVSAVVERYDGDGAGDLPGLRRPVRLYEIGSELSSYEPEPVDEYLAMLGRAYRAAHAAFPGVLVAHAAFLTTNAFRNDPTPAEYDTAFAGVDRRIMHHGLTAIRKVLDRGDLFDVVNLHSLGDPTEIEPNVRWLNWEMARRGYQKRIIISDTAIYPFIAWGPATECNKPARQLGIVIEPATEADRCRLATYLGLVLNGNRDAIRWTHAHTAADMVKRTIIAAEQGVWLINLAFVEDLAWLKLKPFKAGAGASAWSGFIDLARNETRAPYHAVRQALGHLAGYTSVSRLPVAGPGARVYVIDRPDGRRYVAWLETARVSTPADPVPSGTATIDVGGGQLMVEPLITDPKALEPTRSPVETSGGRATVTITPTPIFLTR